MTEDEARAWVRERFGGAKTDLIARFVDMIVLENAQQNLVAPSTIENIWVRHVVDSAQLVELADRDGTWLDVGTGGGFPGMIAAIAVEWSVAMVEPRRKRGLFLEECVKALGLEGRASVYIDRVENVAVTAATISARAVAPTEKLLQATRHCATPTTRWLLPRGRSGDDRVPQGMMFHVKQSITDPDSRILVVERRT